MPGGVKPCYFQTEAYKVAKNREQDSIVFGKTMFLLLNRKPNDNRSRCQFVL